MRTVALFLLLALPTLLIAQKDAKPHVVTGLELTAPQKLVKAGYAKITATVTAKGTKIRIVWSVKAQFADEDAAFKWEKLDEKTVLVAIPDSLGVIAITACAIVDGEPTSDTFAETYIDVEVAKRDGPKQGEQKELSKEPAKQLPKEQAKGRTTAIYLVVNNDADDDADAVALASGQGTKNRLAQAGYKATLFVVGSPDFRRVGLAVFVEKTGTPCVVLINDRNEVRKAVRLKKGDSVESILKLAEGE